MRRLQHTIRVAIATNALITDDQNNPARAIILPLLILSLHIPAAIWTTVTAPLTEHLLILTAGLLAITELLIIGQPRFRVQL